MRCFSLFFAATCGAMLAAQTTSTSVNDVGLTMDAGALTVIYGQACGPFTCRPFPAGSLSPLSTTARSRIVTVHGAPNSLFVLGMSQASIAQPCAPISGIGNALILGQPAALLAFGVTGNGVPSPSVACRQGQGQVQITAPLTLPAGFTFVLQALAMSNNTGGPAFTIALQANIR